MDKEDRLKLFNNIKEKVQESEKPLTKENRSGSHTNIVDAIKEASRNRYGTMSELDMNARCLMLELKIEELERENMLLKSQIEDLKNKIS